MEHSETEEGASGDEKEPAALVDPKRDKKGRFGVGNSGNPGPRVLKKRGTIDDELRALVSDDTKSPASILWEIARGDRAIVNPAQLMALKLLFERLEGKPRTQAAKKNTDPRVWSIVGLPTELDDLAPPDEDEEAMEEELEAAALAEDFEAAPREIEAEVVAAELAVPQAEDDKDTRGATAGPSWLEEDDEWQ